jgi:hypothetical protein
VGKIRGMVLALLIPAVCGAAGVNELAEELVRTAPTPCLDVAMPLQLDSHYQVGVDGLMTALRHQEGLAATWRAGNKHYDDARAELLNALRSDAEIRSLMDAFNGQDWARTVFRRGHEDELLFLSGFFKTPEGILFWQYVLDGGLCEGYFDEFFQSESTDLSPEHLRLQDTWRAWLATRKEEFRSAFGQLDANQRAEHRRALQMIRRFISSPKTLDEQAYQGARLAKFQMLEWRAHDRIYRAMEPKLMAHVDRFKADER